MLIFLQHDCTFQDLLSIIKDFGIGELSHMYVNMICERILADFYMENVSSAQRCLDIICGVNLSKS